MPISVVVLIVRQALLPVKGHYVTAWKHSNFVRSVENGQTIQKESTPAQNVTGAVRRQNNEIHRFHRNIEGRVFL